MCIAFSYNVMQLYSYDNNIGHDSSFSMAVHVPNSILYCQPWMLPFMAAASVACAQ